MCNLRTPPKVWRQHLVTMFFTFKLAALHRFFVSIAISTFAAITELGAIIYPIIKKKTNSHRKPMIVFNNSSPPLSLAPCPRTHYIMYAGGRCINSVANRFTIHTHTHSLSHCALNAPTLRAEEKRFLSPPRESVAFSIKHVFYQRLIMQIYSPVVHHTRVRPTFGFLRIVHHTIAESEGFTGAWFHQLSFATAHAQTHAHNP